MRSFFSRLLTRALFGAMAAWFALACGAVDLSVPVARGWNLLGNGSTTDIDATSAPDLFDAAKVNSLWKWDNASSSWTFYAPSLAADGTLSTYASENSYGVITRIAPGEGFWVDAVQPFTLTRNGISLNEFGAPPLGTGWNLVSLGRAITPPVLDGELGGVSGSSSFDSMWSWDSANSKWNFYSPELAAKNTLADYAKTNGYGDYSAVPTSSGLGFWLNTGIGSTSDTKVVYPKGRITLTAEETNTALLSISTALAKLSSGDLNSRFKAIQNAIAAMPEFDNVGSNPDGSVWAQFKNNGPLVMIVSTPIGSSPIAAQSSGAHKAMASAKYTAQPTDTQARLLYALPAHFGSSPAPELHSMLSSKGYKAPLHEGTSVDELRNVSGDGLFYFQTHGGLGFVRKGDPTDPNAVMQQPWIPTYALWTTTKSYLGDVVDYHDDLENYRVVYMFEMVDLAWLDPGNTPAGNGVIKEIHLGITAAFVDEYMKFGPNSLVFINACRSMSPESDDMRAAFLKKGRAAGYLGWTDNVRADKAKFAARYLLDRLTGANSLPPFESPYQRPFDLKAVLDDMFSKQYDMSYGDDKMAQLRADSRSRFGLLNPSIRNMTMDESKAELTINGLFGPDPGEGNRTVTVGGTAVVVKWGETKLVADLQQPLSGDVIVKIRGRSSNTVPLSTYVGTFNFTESVSLEGVANKQQSFTFHLTFRADVHDYRTEPGKEPVSEEVIKLYPMKDSYVTYNYAEDMTTSIGNSSFRGSGSIGDIVYKPNSSKSSMYVVGYLYPKQKKLYLAMEAIQPDGARDTSGGTTSPSMDTTWLGEENPFLSFAANDSYAIPISLGSTYGIIGGTKTRNYASLTQTLTWQTINLTNAATDQTPR